MFAASDDPCDNTGKRQPMTYTIRQAVILAAGRGERMHPFTLHTPKPLLEIKGVRPLDTIISALHRNHILDIFIVTGFCAEQFAFLQDQPGIRLLYNPLYASTNNITSLYTARDHLEEAMILDGDQIIRDASVLSPFFDGSGYAAVHTEHDTREWVLDVERGRICGCSRDGGHGGWQLRSISHWTAEDGRKLKAHLEEEIRTGQHNDLFWDDIPLFLHPEDYALSIMPIRADALTEIDTPEDLEAYRNG